MQPWQNPALSFEDRAHDLISRMTLEEKISQMGYYSSALSRFGIPEYNWWNECLHGVARAGVATVFPQAIGMAASFNDGLMHDVADAISTEARAKHHAAARQEDRGIYKGLTYWSPNVNIFRDPRWGRGHETYGEDPVLTAHMGVQFIRGLQGDDPKYLKLVATAKHYAVHSGPEALRHEFDAQVGPKDMVETYLPAFEACVKEGKVYSIMGAYNRTNGEPCCGSPTLLQKILREAWGFDGYVVSDCGAVEDFHEHHHITADAAESAALAVNNGCDLCCGQVFAHLKEAVARGLITEQTISATCERLMLARMKLGMFDPEEAVPYAGIPFDANDSEAHHDLSYDMACESMVLLKNDGLLPLDPDGLGVIAVIGPNANSRQVLLGNYNGTPSVDYTVLEGLRALSPDSRVLYAEGCPLTGLPSQAAWGEAPSSMLSEALNTAEAADVVVLVLGMDGLGESEEGDGAAERTSLDLPPLQQQLLEALTALGKPVVLVNLTGSSVDLRAADERCNAILQGWYPGQFGGLAVAATLLGMNNPSGRLPVTFYRDTAQLPPFEDYRMDGRTYRFLSEDNPPLYPFGYGLSYTAFEYRDLTLSAYTVAAGESVEVTATVQNTGDCVGQEVVQLYLTDQAASVRTPQWALCDYGKVELEPGQSAQVSFTLTPKQMAVVLEDGSRVVEPGSFKVYVGGQQPGSRSRALTGRKVVSTVFTVTGEDAPLAR